MQTDLLTKLETAGGSGILPRSATREQREMFALHIKTLKSLGHAFSIDEIIEHGEESGDLRAIHYRTCMACVGVQNARKV